MSIIKRLSAVFAVTVLAAVGAFATATPAHAAVGYVTCATSNVVGVWVDVDGGRDGWAYRRGSGNTNYYSYNTQGKRWRVNVGCGGTPHCRSVAAFSSPATKAPSRKDSRESFQTSPIVRVS